MNTARRRRAIADRFGLAAYTIVIIAISLTLGIAGTKAGWFS